MPDALSARNQSSQAVIYQIRIKGHISSGWSNWFEGLKITLDDSGDTLLTGFVPDQSALHGLLKKVRDLALPLVSINTLDPEAADEPDKQD